MTTATPSTPVVDALAYALLDSVATLQPRDNLRGQPGHAPLFVPFQHVMSNRKHCSACWADVLRKLTFELQSIHAESQPILYLDSVPADCLAEVSEMFSILRETRRDLRLVLHTEPN
jgi:hypothetical protein